jgi:hypothetical protein
MVPPRRRARADLGTVRQRESFAALDVAGGFDCIRISTGASNIANVTQAAYYLESRYPQATPPSAVVD